MELSLTGQPIEVGTDTLLLCQQTLPGCLHKKQINEVSPSLNAVIGFLEFGIPSLGGYHEARSELLELKCGEECLPRTPRTSSSRC